MKKTLTILLAIVFFAACGSKGKKLDNKSSVHKYIAVVENVGGYNVAYTKDGHTIIYYNDSIGNFVAYYAKFDDSAGKHGYDRIRDKAIRVEIDSSLNNLISFVSIYGGASCKINSNGVYTLHCFDKQLNENYIEQLEFPLDTQTTDNGNIESKVKRIIYILTITYNVANSINKYNISGWNYIVSALEPTLSITNYNILVQETIYAQKVKEHVSKLSSTTEGLRQLFLLFLEKEKEVMR